MPVKIKTNVESYVRFKPDRDFGLDEDVDSTGKIIYTIALSARRDLYFRNYAYVNMVIKFDKNGDIISKKVNKFRTYY